MDLGLTDKHVLVTGASKGIGLATARAFAAEGARLTLVARSADTLADAKQQLGETGCTVGTIAADLSTDEGRDALFARCPEVDILVNNAGAIKPGRLADLDMADWHEGWSLKVFGYIHLCKLYSAAMTGRGYGTIVNIIGMGGRAVRSNYICGAAGNAALIGFTNALGAETPASNVRVFGINPSPTLTDRMTTMFRKRATEELGDADRWQELIDPKAFPFGRPKHPDEVAALAAMLASDKVQYLSGTVIDMDGGGQWTA
ncbi:short-chain dehydrogenase/reductase [Ahrensia sp. R2A130]|uniref:short-chain dehydrogenase/reductase n=1 Tax=Ahrensia sp. R2A130 TaxID=744979 RepID=UPI0001E0E10D|nr:short-chain dehydrogenase/reductase [Ahrensia sp. R2A130]EFL87548.1 short chain dehydrogenase [Ahrensia sp. R2A130]